MTGIAMGSAGAMGGGMRLDSPQNISDTEISPAQPFAGFRWDASGEFHFSVSGSYSKISGSIGSTPPGAYECRMVQNSGTTLDVSSGLSTWLAGGTSRTWSYTRTTIGIDTGNFTFEVRRASDSVVVLTCTVVLTANQESA